MRLFILLFLMNAACNVAAAEFPFAKTVADSAAFDTIAGDLPPMLMAKKQPYYVSGDIYVPQGKTVTISAGAVLCFKNFTGLHIMGTLIAKGVKTMPIVFTSENDKDYNKKSAVDAAPYDWNGIYIHEDGIGTQLSYCAVLYSVEGITAQTKFFKLSPCVFLKNGRANLTIDGVVQQVSDQPFEYALSGPDLNSPFSVLKKDPLESSRQVLRKSGITVFGIGCIAALVFAVRLQESQNGFSAISNTSKANLTKNSTQDWTNSKIARDRDFSCFIASSGIAVIGGVGFFWSYRF